MANIVIITPLYPDAYGTTNNTKVVHYFAKEWAKHTSVTVIHLATNFPRLTHLILSMLRHAIYNLQGNPLPDRHISTEENFELDGVQVHRIPVRKLFPLLTLDPGAETELSRKIISCLKAKKLQPDALISHWIRPGLPLLKLLGQQYPEARKTIIVHESPEALMKLASEKDVDLKTYTVGYRSQYHYRHATNVIAQKSFYCPSGIPRESIAPLTKTRKFGNLKCLFVGHLVKRKFPRNIQIALKTLHSKRYTQLSFVGEGPENTKIKKLVSQSDHFETLLTGKLTRKQVFMMMDEYQIFIMISQREIFGLVYLEAMARGMIVIGSRGEGIDGIIQDGKNGFLCNPGNTTELAKILSDIEQTDAITLSEISNHARHTAHEFTDDLVAEKYLAQVSSMDI